MQLPGPALNVEYTAQTTHGVEENILRNIFRWVHEKISKEKQKFQIKSSVSD